MFYGVKKINHLGLFFVRWGYLGHLGMSRQLKRERWWHSKKSFHFLICYTKLYVNEFKHSFMSVSLLETAIFKNEIEGKSINFNSIFGSWDICVFLKIGWSLNSNILVLITLSYILSSLQIGNKKTIHHSEIK